MSESRSLLQKAGLTIRSDEQVVRTAIGHFICTKGGFTPCPWSEDVARFSPVRPGDRVLDLGCGVGPLMLALEAREPDVKLVLGLELDRRRVEQAARNIILNGSRASRVIRADIRSLPIPNAFDLVISNPPFYPHGWGRQSDKRALATATHQLNGDIVDFLMATKKALNPKGQAVFIYDAQHLNALLLASARVGLIVVGLRYLMDDRDKPSRVMLLLSKRGTGLAVETQVASNVLA